MSTTIAYDPDGTSIVLPDGRTLHVWHHHCATCTSVDVWTTNGAEFVATTNGEHVNTGANDRAPFGLFTFANGSRYEMAGGADPVPAVPYDRPVQTTAILIWKDGAK